MTPQGAPPPRTHAPRRSYAPDSSDHLDKIGPEIAHDMENLKLAIKKEQDILGPTASAAMEQAVWIMVIVSVVSVCPSQALLISRSK